MYILFDPKHIVVSFSGGRTSAYMLWRLRKEYPNATIYVVFANTGMEREETLAFVNECSVRWNIHIVWIEAKVNPEKGTGTTYTTVSYETASRKGEPFLEVVKKYGIPGPSHPHCSRELKIVPIAKWVKDNVPSDHVMAIGIRYDELDREGDHWYPLIKWKVTKAVVRLFWKQQEFDLQLADYEGNCDLCYKKSLNKKLTIIEARPESLNWWNDTEKKYGNGHIMSRNYVSYEQMGKLVKRGKFRRVKDGEDIMNDHYDLGLSCTCGVPI